MTNRDELKEEIKLRLGNYMVDVELDDSHLNLAINKAIRRYRQRSGNSLQESYVFLNVQPDVQTYVVPAEIQEIRTVYRRELGATGQSGAAVDPFTLNFTNQIYMIQNPGNISNSGAGTLANYDLAMGFQKLAGRMFGQNVTFKFDPATHTITFDRRFVAAEEFGLHAFLQRSDEILLSDPYARPWLDDYSLAMAKLMLGEARSKFSQLAGPQGGVTLNGEALKTEAAAEIEKLDLELQNNIDGATGYGLTIG